MRKILMKAF